MGRKLKYQQSPAAIEARRDFGVLLRDFRHKLGLSRPKLEQKTGLSAARIYYFEHALTLPTDEEISQYIEVAVQMGYPADAILDAFGKAGNEEKRPGCKLPGGPLQTQTVAPLVPDEQVAREVLSQAAENPKALLESAQCLPVRAQIRVGRINFWEETSAAYNDTADFLLKYSECVDLTEQTRERIIQLADTRNVISSLIKCQCSSLAREAQYFLKRYKKVGEVFDTYASDLPGYILTKNQFYLGMTLNEILLSEQYTRRWAQTLQARALKTFQKRVGELNDERRIGA